MSIGCWQFWIDVGGTFTDCIAQDPAGERFQHKLLSSGVIKGHAQIVRGCELVDPRRSQDPDGVWNGFHVRCGTDHPPVVVERFEGGVLHLSGDVGAVRDRMPYELTSEALAPLVAIRYLLGCSSTTELPPIELRLGTTRGTNALLTRTGSRTALVTTKGFRDVLKIGYQARSNLFALNISKPEELYEAVVEVDERVMASGEVRKPCERGTIEQALRDLRMQGIQSLAIVLLHACVNPRHELVIDALAREVGFESISLSHRTTSLRKVVPRGDTTVIDAYLNPVLREYVETIAASLHPDSSMQLLTSSGALTDADHFCGKDSILSGPAGGVVGVAHVADSAGFQSAIGFDMGGTSTDVSRWADEFPLEYETKKAGVRIATPMMAIETVAAGGGSVCAFDGVKLTVGPASAGADPGPACYGRGGPLAVTDINLFLGKLPDDAFPFALDRDVVESLLQEQCHEILRHASRRYSPVELALGYLRIANTNMAEAIRCVTVDQGIDPRDDVLVAFGGAAGQHACAVASELDMREVLLHPCGGILSALGIGRAETAVHREAGVYAELTPRLLEELEQTFRSLELDTKKTLSDQGEVATTRYLDLRFVGLEEPTTVRQPLDGDYRRHFEDAFRKRCGYIPRDAAVEVVTARVSAVVSRLGDAARSQLSSTKCHPRASRSREVYFDQEASDTAIFARESLTAGSVIAGPAIVTEAVSTIVLDPGWTAEVMTGGELLLRRTENLQRDDSSDSASADPVLLEVCNKRFAAIATQMGSTLRKNSRSVNVKERLDFSCAIFTADGELVVNAPHIPVHLGAMGATVRHVLDTMALSPGDVVVSNDPYRGGSHLPDVTVITPVHDEVGQLMFLTASRAHHAEIGGISPGSMPAFSTRLHEEGVLIRSMKVIEAGSSRMDQLEELLRTAEYPSRDPATNIADVTAQIAANRQGARRLLAFVDEYSWRVVSRYMDFIQQAAEQKTRQAIAKLPRGRHTFVDHLDDGSPIELALTVKADSAVLDFSGTGDVLPGNLNANRAIVSAAALYCLRLLIDEDIPLNAGVLHPIEIVLPHCLLHPQTRDDPRHCPALVGGNVETSQRVVDVILGAFGIAAASQGTMNNFLFGDDTFGYYETICGGAGATSVAAGADAVHTHMTNTRLTDVEVLESKYPVFLRRFEIRKHSGGAGKYGGGCGVVREVEFLAPLEVSLLTQRRGAFLPYGVAGGEPGSRGVNMWCRADGTELDLGAIAHVQVTPGDAIRLETPGGGGWGKYPK